MHVIPHTYKTAGQTPVCQVSCCPLTHNVQEPGCGFVVKSGNIDSLFYLTTTVCHLLSLLYRAFGRSAEWATLI
jgi:hypothetical protein